MRCILLFIIALIAVPCSAETGNPNPSITQPKLSTAEIMKKPSPARQSELAQMLQATKGLNPGVPCNAGGDDFTKYGCDLYSRKDNNKLLKEVTFRGGVSSPFKAQSGGFQLILTW